MRQGIAFFSSSIPPDFGGAGKRTFNQAKYMADDGKKVTVITFTQAEFEYPNLTIKSIKTPKWYKNSGKIYKLFRLLYSPIIFIRITRAIKQEDFGLVHCIPGFSNITALVILACKIVRKPIIVETTLFGSDDPFSAAKGLFSSLKRSIFKQVDGVVSISPLLDKVCEDAGFSEQHRYIIPNSIDVDKFRPEVDKNKLRELLGVNEFSRILLYVGILRERKGVADLIYGFKSMEDKLGNCCLVLVGPTDKDAENIEYTQYLRDTVERLGLTDKILFIGESQNVDLWMKASDLFLFASQREGFGTVLIEAMSTGLPVVTTNIEGITNYIIENKVDGCIVENSAEIFDVVKEILDNPSVYDELSRNARKNSMEKFNISKVMTTYYNLYESILNARL